MKKRRILMGKTHLIAGAVMLAVAGGQLSAQTVAPKKAKAYMVADAHLDTQWNWDIQTTIKDYVWNTLNQNLFLLNQYPDYIFNFEGGVKYAWMKEYYPREYELMKAFVKAGRWHVSGASWDATDTLVPSVESFIRVKKSCIVFGILLFIVSLLLCVGDWHGIFHLIKQFIRNE